MRRYLIIAGTLVLMSGCTSPEKAWRVASEENTEQAYEEFLSEYPNSQFGPTARESLDELRWKTTAEDGTTVSYKNFLESYPDSRHAEEALRRLDELEWSRAQGDDTPEAYESYLSELPKGAHAAEAEEAADDARWRLVSNTDSEGAYREFIDTYPSSSHTEEARTAIQILNTIAEARKLIVYGRLRAKGLITVRARGTNCGDLRYNGSFEATGDSKIPQAQVPGYLVMFTPGVQHRFLGRVCLPNYGEPAEISEEFVGDGVSNSDGEFVFDGPIKLDGKLSYDPRPGGFFEIVTDTDSGLVLEVSSSGYVLSTGTGSVKTPQGRVFRFKSRSEG